MAKDIIQVSGLDTQKFDNASIDSLETEEVYLLLIGIDSSISMDEYVGEMHDELIKFKESIVNSKECDNILVSRIDFSDFLKIHGYQPIDRFDTSYQTYGSTKLYDTITVGQDNLLQYIKLLRSNGMRVKCAFAIFSDGQNTVNNTHDKDAKKSIEELNKLEIPTVFIAFGSEAISEAKKLGFIHILDTTRSESELRRAFSQLSKSVISHSQAVIQKTDDFFSL